jgi:ABC-type antimicrobial peptide transport system permease subunit
VGGIWIVAEHDLRRRWLSVVAIALLIGGVGAVVTAAAAGARRSGTAVERFNAFSRSSDLEIDVGQPSAAQIRAFARATHSDIAVVHAYAISPDGRPNLAMGAPLDNALGSLVDRPRLIAGRLANPNAPDEVRIGEALSAQEHLPLGGYLDASSLSPAQLAAIEKGSGEQNAANHPAGPRLHLRVVGITRRPFDLSHRSASGGVVLLTPAFDRKYAGRVAVFSAVLRVRTPNGGVQRDDVAKVAQERFGKDFNYSVSDAYAENRGAASAVNVVTIALWLFAAIAALAGIVAIAVIVARDVVQTTTDQSTLAAIGFTRRDRIGAVFPRAVLIALTGAVLAVAGAVALSPLFPVGIARRSDPDTGVHADWFAVAVGAGALIAITLLVAGVSALRATRGTTEQANLSRSTRAVAAVIGGSGLAPSPAIGVAMAVDRGRGERSLLAATSFLAAVTGVLGVTAALVFAASFGHLVATPKLFGWTWDFKAPDNTFSTPCGPDDFGLHRMHGVTDVAAICYQPVEVDGRNVVGWAFQHVRGTIDPTIVAGRAPRGGGEVALGTKTLAALHKTIGDRVRVTNRAGTRDYHVVGKLVLPQIKDGDVQPLADGAAFTQTGMKPLIDDSATRYLVGRYAPGVDRARVQQAVAAIPQFGRQSGFLTDTVGDAVVPPEIDRIRTVNWLPPTLAALTAFLALIAVGQGLVSSVRRRRNEFAVLKALGFRPRQVEGTVAWQATTIVAVGFALGIPLGILVGRVAWNIVAESLGIAAGPVTPLVALALLVPFALVVVNLLAFLPGRAAAHTRPAVALAAE